MIKNTIEKIESSIKKLSSVNDKKKNELTALLSTLKAEIEKLARTHGEQAQSIAGFAAVAAHESTRDKKESRLQKLSLEGLSSSVTGFEVSHPKLVKTVNDFCEILAGIGI